LRISGVGAHIVAVLCGFSGDPPRKGRHFKGFSETPHKETR
jgi:hypothetical protein